MTTTSRRLLKRVGKQNVHTPGKTKGENCQASALQKYYFCSPKAYKDKEYPTWHQKAINKNKGSM